MPTLLHGALLAGLFGVGAAYLRRFPCFAVLCLFTAAQGLFYEPGVSWYAFADSVRLLLVLLAVSEAWYYFCWGIPERERALLGLLCGAMGLLVVGILLGRLPEERWWYNVARISVHAIGCVGLAISLLYSMLYPPWTIRSARLHAALLTLWLSLYVAVATPPAAELEDWDSLRRCFQAGSLALMGGWLLLRFQPRKARVERIHLPAQHL